MKHALETQAALVALARSLAPATVTIHAADGRISFDSQDWAALNSAWDAFTRAYRPTADGRKVTVSKHTRTGARVWRLVDAPDTFRRVAKLALTEDEHGELIAGAWYGRQLVSRGGPGELVAAASPLA
jgi:hypothetical protein